MTENDNNKKKRKISKICHKWYDGIPDLPEAVFAIAG